MTFSLPPGAQAHPGLLLDKWHDPWPTTDTKTFACKQLSRVISARGDQTLLDRFRNRFEAATSGGRRWRRRTSGPLTLHLSRAGSFENAGICLHSIYGFAYLPGTGIKGMARSYARNVARASTAEMDAVFGKDTTAEEDGASGGIIFFDALPVKWPGLIVDIVNNHHSQYYQGTSAPEDWEAPIPVTFLAVCPGTEFEFSIASRHVSGSTTQLLELAQPWIDGALAWLGAGAKTNTGYGRFSTGAALNAASGRKAFTSTITFVSPAFLAGAVQNREDCTLRPATLRGLLRSWWRTLHSGYIPLESLREMEGDLWGTTVKDGAISLHLEPVSAAQVGQFNFPKPRNADPIPGRFYLSYGMEGNPKQDKKARWYTEPGAKWKVTLVARATETWDSKTVLDQAAISLWLLSEFGGIGAKGRRSFGSFDLDDSALPLPTTPEDALTRAAKIRPGAQYKDSVAESPPLNKILFRVLPLKTNDLWSAIDRLGAAYRSFTASASEKRRPEKLCLGLPRNIGRRGVDQRPIKHPAGQKYSRHASPLHFRLLKDSAGYSARVTALPSPHLPDLQSSREYLKRCMDHMYAQLH